PYLLGGLLVRGEGWPEHAANGTEGAAHFLIFPRPDHLARLYLAVEPGPHTGGADRTAHFLESFRLDCLPYGEALASAEPAGPCAYVRGSDSWTDRPVADGVVLIGDAAGWTDPIIGEGLSVAMRDARMVADVLLGDDWSLEAFEPYVRERAERCRRLRMGAHVVTEMRCTFTPAGRQRREAFGAGMMTDPLSLGLMISLLAGPETAPDEAFTQDNVDRLLALA
ncbi:MAG: hypothetical protein MUE78_04240, partial [Ilumatobacteraceae bacterium]|nr:hypothetical protein [Ilumatobacteraceae bacterium]